MANEGGRISLRVLALLARLDETLTYAIEHEGGLCLDQITNYAEVKSAACRTLAKAQHDLPELLAGAGGNCDGSSGAA